MISRWFISNHPMILTIFLFYPFYLELNLSEHPRTLKYWFGVQRGQSYLMGRRCLLLPRLATLVGVDVLLHRPATHPVFFYWFG